MIVKATVKTNSANDPEGKGRVKIEAPTIWENSSENEDYVPVNGTQSLNVGDVVFVYISNMDFANPLILGKCRDNNWVSNGTNPDNFTVLWESVYQSNPDDASTKEWSVLYVRGTQTIYENSEGTVMTLKGKSVDVKLPIDDSNATEVHIDPENVSYKTPKSTISVDKDGNVKVVTQGTVTSQGEGETAAQPTPLGDTLKEQLQKISSRVDAVVDAVTQTLGAGVPAPMDGGAALKSTMQAAWSAASSTLKFDAKSYETWDKILNTSVTTAGKAK